MLLIAWVMRGESGGEKDGTLRFRHPSGVVTTTSSNSKEVSFVLTITLCSSLVLGLFSTESTVVDRRTSALLRALLATRWRMAL